MEKYYAFAGVELAVDIPDSLMYTDDRTLEPFRVETVTDPHIFRFGIVERLSPPAGPCIARMPEFSVYAPGGSQVRYIGTSPEDAYIRAEHREKDHGIQLKASVYTQGISAKTVLNSIAAEHLIARSGGFVLHSSYIQWQDRAILFTAPSGTGKSTQAELWRTLRSAEVVNGDRSAVRVTGDGIVASGVPFAGSSQICKNRTLPLAAIVYLSQAPQTAIRTLGGAEAFRRVWEGVSVNIWDKTDVTRVSEGVEQTIRRVPVYHLACTPDESAVSALERMLKE